MMELEKIPLERKITLAKRGCVTDMELVVRILEEASKMSINDYLSYLCGNYHEVDRDIDRLAELLGGYVQKAERVNFCNYSMGHVCALISVVLADTYGYEGRRPCFAVEPDDEEFDEEKYEAVKEMMQILEKPILRHYKLVKQNAGD